MDKGQSTDPGDGEQTNPLDAEGDTETKTRKNEPEPPSERESLLGTKLMLVGKAGEGKSSESGRDNEGRVEENQASLSQ